MRLSMAAHSVRMTGARSEPLIVGLESHAEPVVAHSQDTFGVAAHRIRPHELHLLRHHADIGFVAAVVAEPVESKPVVETAEVRDVVLHIDIGAASAASATTAAASSASAGSHSATATTAMHSTTAAAAAMHSTPAAGAVHSAAATATVHASTATAAG